MLNHYYNILNFGISSGSDVGISPESDLSSIPELDSDSSFEELQHYPTQLIYSPIIKPIKTRIITKNIIKFIFRDEGKKIKKLKI